MKPSERIMALYNCPPHAKIAWPHRELHEIAKAVEAIEAEHFTPEGAELPTWKQLAELWHQSAAWQTIDTAPKDGRDVLLTSPVWFGDYLIGGFHFGAWRQRPDPKSQVLDPTHFMLIPPLDVDFRVSAEGEVTVSQEADGPTIHFDGTGEDALCQIAKAEGRS